MSDDPVVARALVVYESMFGNTRAIAEAIAEGLADRCAVRVMSVADAPRSIDNVDVLVVGGPTHAFGMSRPGTRAGARDKGATEAVDVGVREWLADVAVVTTPALAVAFDTRIGSPLLPGSARRPITRRLRRMGLTVVKPASFIVTGTAGPLAAGQVDAAVALGAVPARDVESRQRAAMSTESTQHGDLEVLDETVVRDRLRRADLARIAYVDGDQPVIVPVNIVADESEHVLLRTAAGGPLAALDGRRVAIEIDGHEPGERSGWSILVRGVARDVTDAPDIEARRWQRTTVDTWAPGVRDRLIVVLPLSITGRAIPLGAGGGWFAGVPGS